jgi:hypothetical protein
MTDRPQHLIRKDESGKEKDLGPDFDALIAHTDPNSNSYLSRDAVASILNRVAQARDKGDRYEFRDSEKLKSKWNLAICWKIWESAGSPACYRTENLCSADNQQGRTNVEKGEEMAILRVVAQGTLKDPRGNAIEVDLETGMLGSAQEAILFAALTRLEEVAREKGFEPYMVRNITATIVSGDDNAWPFAWLEHLKNQQKQQQRR